MAEPAPPAAADPARPAAADPAPPARSAFAEPAVRRILKSTGPRVARDGFGPLLAFYAGWKLAGLLVGIGAAVVTAVVLYRYERFRERPAVVVRFALVLVLIRASVGLVTGNTHTYLGQEIAIDTLIGSVFLISLALGRPVTELMAGEIFPLPDFVREAERYKRTVRLICLTWGLYFIVRALVRLAAFLSLSSDGYLLVVAISDVPFLIALLAWSVAITVRELRAAGLGELTDPAV